MDGLSCLPDELIRHILSFLPTMYSVQTSVLSKRWRFLWAQVPSLEFYVQDIRTVNFISQFLLQHNHDIHTFCLILDTDDLINGIEKFESLIVNITTRNIRNLIIIVGGDKHFGLPEIPCLFTCKTLVELSIFGCAGIPVSGICFPALKKLKLASVRYKSQEDESLSNVEHVLSGCPVLEELSIEGRMLGYCCVSSLVLTRLVLRLGGYPDLDDDDEFLNFGLKLDTPGLRYLQLYSVMSDKFLIGSLDSLIEADIRLLSWDHQDSLIYSRNVLAFVAKLCNVTVLKLSTDRMLVIHDSTFFDLANKFHNLTELDLRVSPNFSFITSFLENASNLRVLHLTIQYWVVTDHQCYWMEPKQVPACLMSHLRTVDICHIGCSEPEFDMIRYILMNARVLKRMEIHPLLHENDWKNKFEAVKRLALFEIGSRECELVVH